MSVFLPLAPTFVECGTTSGVRSKRIASLRSVSDAFGRAKQLASHKAAA
ncbi:hypothetical protein [Muricoccus aerilatus]|nr:hypothetical protein [Roseomonas aerilata]